MKKFLFLTLFFMGCASQPYIKTEVSSSIDIKKYSRVAILSLGEDYLNLKNTISELFITEFLGMGFDVIERSHINAVLKELKLNASGAITVNDLKEIKKLVNVDALLIGSVIMRTKNSIYTFNLRFIDVDTGGILWSSTYLNINENIKNGVSRISSSIQETFFGRKDKRITRVRIAKNTHAKIEEIKKIAILPFSGTNYRNAEKAFRGSLTTNLIGNKIRLVERSRLDDILKEQFLYAAGLFSTPENDIMKSSTSVQQLYLSKKDLLKIGNLTGADALLIGSISPIFYYDNTVQINIANLRLLNVATGRIMYSVSYYNDLEFAKDDIVDSSFLISSAITPAIKNPNEKNYLEKVCNLYKKYYEFSPHPMLFGIKN